MKTDLMKSDRRFASVANQAAKVLGVKITGEFRRAYAVYGSDQSKLDAYRVGEDILVISGNDEAFQGAIISEDVACAADWDPADEQASFASLADAAGIVRPDDLYRARRDELKFERMFS